jgi:hypothetical protein
MKRFLIGIVAIVTLLAFFSSALAIDRNPKDSKAKEKVKPAEFKEGKKPDVKEGKATSEMKSEEAKHITPEKLTERLKSQDKQSAEEKYDYFIDKNHNGIDDRLEGQKPKEPVSPATIRPVQKEKQPAKSVPPVKETDKKKTTKETPKKQKVKEAKKIEGKKKR